jgi:hypothetical protein
MRQDRLTGPLFRCHFMCFKILKLPRLFAYLHLFVTYPQLLLPMESVQRKSPTLKLLRFVIADRMAKQEQRTVST